MGQATLLASATCPSFLGGKMEEENKPEEESNGAQVTPVATKEARQEYDLHIKVAESMRQKLRDCTVLAFEMGDIPKPDLVDLMNLSLGWSFNILYLKWLDPSSYK